MKAIYPESLLHPGLVDEHFATEADLLTDFPARAIDGRFRVARVAEGEAHLYRGWILSPADYVALETAVHAAGGTLVVSSEQYIHDQFAEHWLDDMSAFMGHMNVVVPYDASDEMVKAAVVGFPEGSRFYVKGSSKSAKHNRAASVADSVEALPVTLQEFRKEVSASQENFILIREFVDFVGHEYRTWWSYGKLACAQVHPQSVNENEGDDDTGGFMEFLNSLASTMERMNSPLVTVDVRKSVDGRWHVVEMGSGTVSESAQPINETLHLTPLSELFEVVTSYGEEKSGT